jgi:kinesin family protein 1
MIGNQTILDPPEPGSAQAGRATERKSHVFTFDKSYWSAGPRDDPQYCSQETLYNDLGVELLDHGFSGFNACILACMSVLLDQFRAYVLIQTFRWTNGYGDCDFWF